MKNVKAGFENVAVAWSSKIASVVDREKPKLKEDRWIHWKRADGCHPALCAR